MVKTMTLNQAHTIPVNSENVSARWFTIAVITGTAFLGFAVLAYVIG